MPRVTHRDLTRGIFIFIFSKNLKIVKKNQKKKIKMKIKKSKNHRLTRGTLTNDVSQLRLKGT